MFSTPRSRRALAALAVAALWLGGCTDVERAPRQPAVGRTTPVYGGDLVYAGEDDIRTMDPAVAYDEVSWNAMHLVFETLLDYDDDVKLAPSLARAWDVSDDGLVWTFHLRDDVRFHNGRPMVAADVVYSWTRLFDPSLASPGADFFGHIQGATDVLEGKATAISGLSTPDPHTVAVTLVEPDGSFGNMVALMFGAVVPREEVERWGDQWRYHPVGTGPYAMAEWRLGERTVFEANLDYWQPGLPYLDRVVRLAQYSWSLQFLKLEADEVHQVNRLTSPDFLWVKRSPDWSPNLVQIPSVDTYAEMMNTELPPFDDVWFRRAVSTAIDRDKLAKLRNGRITPTVSWIPVVLGGGVTWEELSPQEQELYKYQRYDPELSAACLEKAGFPDGYPEPITYWTLTSESSLVTAQSIQQDLAAVGIPIELKNVTFPVYLTAAGRRGTVQMAYGAWVMDYPDARNFLETKFHCDQRADENSNNDAFYCNAQVDALLDAARVEVDPDRRAALYREAQGIMVSEVPYAMTYHSTTLSLTQPYVRDFRVHPVWSRDMRFAWFDLPEDGVHGRASRGETLPPSPYAVGPTR